MGTLWGGLSVGDPYAHGFLGVQVSEPLSIVLRQSAEASNPLKDPDRFYPGFDFKLRLHEESRFRPQLALGVQSATGHKRLGGEYLALSKRYKDFDFTAGLGWGRYGSAFQIDNPLKHLSSHFDKPRALDGEMPVQPSDWFSGEKIGLFGGLEYFTPFKGVSVKADIGADRYTAEKSAFAFTQPAPWSLGLNYHTPLSGTGGALDAGIAAQGVDRIMARLSLSGLLSSWQGRARQSFNKPFPPYRPQGDALSMGKAQFDAQKDHIVLGQMHSDPTRHSLKASLSYQPAYSLPSQIGAAAAHMAADAAPDIERISVTPGFLGLQGPSISLLRRDIEKLHRNGQGSAAELWHHAEIGTDSDGLGLRKRPRHTDLALGFMPFKLELDQQISLAEEDYGALYRTALVAKALLPRKTGYFDYGAALRFNLANNLKHIEDLRPKATLPVRSNVVNFAKSFVGLDEAYIAFTHSFKSDLHVAAMSGYLEEMYAGTGGEILYRPFKSRLALGAEAFLALKRDPDSMLNLAPSGDQVLTGQLNAYYDWPSEDITVKAALGRFLNEDSGARLGFIKAFKNGAQLEGFVTLSNTADLDLFGGTTHADHGLRLTLPLGGFKHIPDYASAKLRVQPFGRDIGQSIQKPLDLYDLTTPFTLPHLMRHWGDVAP